MITILAIVSMGCAVWLFGENRALKQINKKLVKSSTLMVDDYLDLQVEYEMLFDDCLDKKQRVNKVVVLYREQVSKDLEYEYFDTLEQAKGRCSELKKNYNDSIWVNERDLLKMLMSVE